MTDTDTPRRATVSVPHNPAATYEGVQATVGRVVHYVAWGVPGKFPQTCRSAEITEVDEQGRVGLAVTNPTGLFFHPINHENGPCPYSDEVRGGTWHWPERS